MNAEHDPAQEITLRAERAQDEALLYQLYADTRAEELAALDWDPAAREAFVRMQFLAQRKGYRDMFPNAAFSIILAGGQPIGRIVVNRKDDEVRLVDLVLLPPFRNRGIGTQLLAGLCAEAATTNKPLRLHVLRGSRARRFYERLEFYKTGDTGVYEEMERRAKV